MMVAQAVLKTLYEVIALPVTYRVVGFVKRLDHTDVYDNQVSYNVFKL